ncbi:hypothetical protein PI124_g12168 [Phytophthora idaei]|nr:hypothetical protein PI125_g11810 [Phytophthora idaei]KAG3242993.1 hypothetical protein PI124_g12168 [Phytophthora idaei]
MEVQARAGVSSSNIFATIVLSDKHTLTIPSNISNIKKASCITLLATQTSNEAPFNC